MRVWRGSAKEDDLFSAEAKRGLEELERMRTVCVCVLHDCVYHSLSFPSFKGGKLFWMETCHQVCLNLIPLLIECGFDYMEGSEYIHISSAFL